jgi:hypothetical protein
MNCFDYKDGSDSGGNPIMKRKCYCGTTGCLQIKNSTPKYCCEDDCDTQDIDWEIYHQLIGLI